MVDKKIKITDDTPHSYKFPSAAVEILNQLYTTKKEPSSQLVKTVMELYKEGDASIAFITLAELTKTGLIVKEEETSNDTIYSITEKGSRLVKDALEKRERIMREIENQKPTLRRM